MPVTAATGGPRVAVRTEPALGTREDALFLPAHGDELFCVLHRPAVPPRGGVVICPSLFAEQLKLYRTEVLAARALAAAGFAVARFHYRGTGHSGGEMARVTLGAMLEDAAQVAGFLRQGIPSSALAFCGARWGGLVAGLAAAEEPAAPLILWEPVLEARRFLQEILRARQISALAGGLGAPRGGAAQQELAAVGWVDALGYPVHRALFDSAAGRHLLHLGQAGPRPLLLVQISRRADLRPEMGALRDAMASVGGATAVALLNAEEAWSFIGSPLRSAGALIAATVGFLLDAVPENRG